MKVFRYGSWTLQLYYPQIVRVQGGYNLVLRTAITIAKSCFGLEILGVGVGIGHEPSEAK